MTDATMGPGPEGTPRESKSRGNAAPPVAPDHDRTTGSPAKGSPAVPAAGSPAKGSPAAGSPATPAAGSPATGSPATSDPATVAPRHGGGETAPGGDTALGVPGGGLGGETATGRDGALNASGTSGLAGTPDRAGPSHPLGATAREGSGTPDRAGPSHPLGATAREGSGAPGREAPGTPDTPGTPLLPHEESDKLALRLQHAIAGFVDGPRDAVEEADHVLEEAASRFTDAVTQRRRTLRMSWQMAEGGAGKPATSADTEQLRLALRDYRELAERLLRL
ncbi:hypothetical protein [Streptomyces sp. NL15-2K]|uniref:hypothetical protein n=1 Tax=Streptomyces sp. NL15-2K TaxID=376149 RepID=UPI000FF90F7C|nr:MULTISPECIES: hypothetical protein [Actinomycetes]WKX08696.1 hypothetical protein Q4V64_14845 [Kutzneria buriramensis]GCB49820.1 hypothetical protein SNL152K_7163 [Streptomyces sp. NL15-2K]